MSPFARVLDLLLPPLCLACRTPVADHGALCRTCWPQVAFISSPVCERLGVPMPPGLGHGALSPEAMAEPPDYDRARAAFRFEGHGRTLVHGLKYGDRPELARTLARWMARAGAALIEDADVIVPVPLHWTRLFRRRMNQSAEIAREIAALSGRSYVPDLLQRTRATGHQTDRTRAQRKTSMQGAFSVSQHEKSRVHGLRVLLIDDVLTTGATANACARALRRAGAVRIDVLTAARVVARPIGGHMT